MQQKFVSCYCVLCAVSCDCVQQKYAVELWLYAVELQKYAVEICCRNFFPRNLLHCSKICCRNLYCRNLLDCGRNLYCSNPKNLLQQFVLQKFCAETCWIAAEICIAAIQQISAEICCRNLFKRQKFLLQHKFAAEIKQISAEICCRNLLVEICKKFGSSSIL